jgi:hypothetical protein
MNSRPTDVGRSIQSSLALLAMAATVLLLSPAAQAQHRHGSGGSQLGGRGAAAPQFHRGSGAHQFNRGSGDVSGFRHNGFVARGGHHHHHRGFGRAVVIGGFGFGYPYAYPYYAYPYPYPYPYDSSLAAATVYNLPPPAPTWYYCDGAGAYYPYVATCPGGWREVPATPNETNPAPQQ